VLCVFLLARGINANDIHQELSAVHDGKCLSCIAIQSWVEKSGKRFPDEEVETEVRKWLRQQSKSRWNMRINVGGGYIEI
jgi:hypothetical protein